MNLKLTIRPPVEDDFTICLETYRTFRGGPHWNLDFFHIEDYASDSDKKELTEFTHSWLADNYSFVQALCEVKFLSLKLTSTTRTKMRTIHSYDPIVVTLMSQLTPEGKSETEKLLEEWTPTQLSFSKEVLKKAVEKGITDQPSFDFCDRVLSNWSASSLHDRYLVVHFLGEVTKPTEMY